MEEQSIDLTNLNQRELLILVYTKVEAMEKLTSQHSTKQASTDIQIAVIKTKMQMWSAVIGFVSGAIGSILMLVMSKILDK